MKERERLIGHADTMRPDDEGHGVTGNKRNEELEFEPLPDNAAFFGGEPRGFSMMYFCGFQRARDGSRLELLFSDPFEGNVRIVLRGHSLRALLTMIRWRKVATVTQVKPGQAMQAEAADMKAGFTVTGMEWVVQPEG